MADSLGPETAEVTIERLEKTVGKLRTVMVLGALVVGVMLVYLAVLQIQVSGINRQLDDIKAQTDKIGGFVDELEQERANPDDSVSVEELRRVFGLVEDTVALLCNQYPDDPVCVQG